MPKSRNSRSVSPQKPVSADSLEIERRKIYQNVHDIFCEAVDGDVIKLVIQECNWKEEESIEKLLVIAENVDEQRKYKSKLQRIAEGIFGSLRSEDYAQPGVSSTLSQSDRVIRRPTKPPTSVNNDKISDQPAEKPVSRGIHHHGYPPQPVPSASVVSVDEIEMDLNFPQLPSRVSELNKSSASSSVTSQRSFNEVTKTSLSSKTALLSQAQSAYSQQFDDAEGTQRWEEYKDKLSEHYLTTLKDANDSLPKKSPSASVFPDDPAILQAELARPKSDPLLMRQDIEKQRSESSRSFPVRLLSRSPDSLEDLKTLPVSSIGHGNVNKPDDFLRSTGDLDETVLKCIYEIHDDLLDDSELERHSKLHSADSKLLAKSSNEPMTLPTIGLSANAAEFVPRPKPVATTTTAAAASTTEVVDSPSPEPTSRTKRSNSEELKPGMRKGGASISSPSIPIGSPLTISPALSPGLSPQMNSPVANLTGSPMFITPKWPQVHTGMAPLQHVVLAPPQRYVHPTPAHHISPPYRFPPTASVPYSSRMVYSVAPPPMFRAAGMPPYVQQPNLQSLEDRAAVATGQPIMATSESSTAVLSTVMLAGQNSIEQKVEKVRKQQQSGVKVLIIVRGLPGSGKSTLARALQLNGIVLSTDDYFMNGNRYEYKPEKLNDAHQWNKERAKEAMKMGKSPIIIDNTNTMVWEFKPYITMGVNNNYHVEIFEPDTPWKFKPSELARRTLHGVPVEHIKRMLQRYEHNITIDSVLKTKSTPDLKSYTASDEPELSQLSTGSDDKSTISQEDVPMPSIKTPDSRIGKDVRFQTLNKSEEFRKQKSGESDSDSLSSYHSETWSNQSSRNASPKPLRSSLKTPGTLQKMEKLKPIGNVKQGTVKPTVRKVKRKAIKQIEAKLSSDTLNQVNEMVREHVNGQVLSVEDVSKTEEELKALLQFCAIDEAELASAEELIGLKLHDAIHQSFEGPDVNIEGSGTESEGDTKSADSLTTLNESSSNLCDEIDGEYNSHEEKKVEFGLGDPDVTGEENESPDHLKSDSNNKRPMPSWMDIATVKASVSCNSDLLNDSVVSEENAEVVELTGESVSRTHEEFELKYWSGETDINGMKVESTVETADHVWDGEKWEGTEKDGEKCVKPQRMKNNRRDKSLSEERDRAMCDDSANSNLDSSVLSHDDNDEVYESCSDVENDEHGLNNENEMTSSVNLTSSEDNLISKNLDNCLVNSKSDEINTYEDGGHIENISGSSKLNLQSTENSLSCSGSIDVTSKANDEPNVHDQSESSVNSSLQLLKDSYTDTESAIKSSINNNDCDNDLLVEVASSDVKDIVMKQDETAVECELSERDSLVERKGEDDVCKESVKDVIRESKPSSDQKMKQSLTKSEVIKKDTEKGPSGENSAPGSPKKKSSRNRNGKKVPFLNSEDTEKFKMSDWSSFPLVSNEGVGVVMNGNVPVSNRNMTTVGTMTSVEYFNIVVQLNQGGFVSEDIKYLNGNPGKKLVNGVTNEFDIKKDVERPAEVCLLEKSTTTADLVSLNSSEGVEFLQTCFPAVENEELECVLEMCSNNVEWAINLLLDWKYSMNLTQEEKKDFSDKMAEIQKDKGTDNVQTELTDMEKGPSSLLDMCFNFIEKENIANRGDIESQMIKTGKERLDTIEKDNITKIKLHRSLSRGESSLDKSALLNSLDEASPDLSNLNYTHTRTHVEDTEVFSSKTESESRKESILNGTAGVSFDDYIRGKIMKSSLPEQRDITTTDAHIEPVMTMDIRPDVITQLEDMFGPLQRKDNANSKLSVPIDRKTAWMLYQCVKNCLVRSPVDDQQQLLRDEEFARQLQEEEEAYKKLELNKTSNGTRTTRATPTIGFTVKGTILSQHEQVSWSSGNKSLAEIMREQQQHQDSQNEFQKMIENEGAHTVLSTRLKRQKLYEAFPAVDKTQLDEIFQACCFNLSETIQAISTSLNEGPYKFPIPVTSSTPQVPEPDDQQLIEAAKQQSIDEMMDLCSYHPGTGKDYQDGMEPEYEDYRGEANLHHKLRQECFLKAREAYRRGLKQVASFYSQQGHQHTQKLKEANMRASDQILADRNDDIERNKTLDLHGLHIDEAREALTRIIPQKERERCKQLTVITGRGSHSKGGVAKLRPAVIDYLNRNKYNYTELSVGVFRVSLKYRTPDRYPEHMD